MAEPGLTLEQLAPESTCFMEDCSSRPAGGVVRRRNETLRSVSPGPGPQQVLGKRQKLPFLRAGAGILMFPGPWGCISTGIGAPSRLLLPHTPVLPPPIRMLPPCSSVPTSWTRRISLGSLTRSWCSTEATKMEREFQATRHPLSGVRVGWVVAACQQGGLGPPPPCAALGLLL